MSISERRACKALGQHRSTQRKTPRGHDDEEALTADLIELARQYGRYGYRKIAAFAGCGLAGERQARRTHLAPRGAQGSPEAAQARAAVARGRILLPPSARAPQPCLVLRLCRGSHP